jgi:hypothetical protein
MALTSAMPVFSKLEAIEGNSSSNPPNYTFYQHETSKKPITSAKALERAILTIFLPIRRKMPSKSPPIPPAIIGAKVVVKANYEDAS